ncbi:MAG: tautomerase family protein [Actinomycetota bacterium]
MPFYHAVVRPDVLAVGEREALATDITDLRCEITGAPRTFVQVLFTVDDSGRLPSGVDCSYRANIRSGRTPQQTDELTTRLRDATVARTTAAPSAVVIQIQETEASFVMEGGRLLPEPGSPEEEAWKAQDQQVGAA